MATRIPLKVVTLLMCVAMALAGCHVSTSPQSVAILNDKKPPSMIRARWNGQYALYPISADKKAPRIPVRSVHLKKDDPLGFRIRETGVVAAAGDLEVPVSTGAYEWIMSPDPDQIDPLATGILITVIVIVVVAVVVAGVILFAEAVGPAVVLSGAG